MGLNNRIRRAKLEIAGLRKRITFPRPGDDSVTLEQLVERGESALSKVLVRRARVRRAKVKAKADRR